MMKKSTQPFDLTEHPEGGRFREVFRSGNIVTSPDGRSRSALTHIYFSLRPGEISRFHKVSSDEVWNLYQGTGLRLYLWNGTSAPPERTILAAGNNCFCRVVPAGMWQAAEPISDAVLVGCTVAPGFEFSDFALMDPDSAEAKLLVSIAPELTRYTVSDKERG